ncbi:hypothetical protein ACFV06_14580 [Streptomyces sp. NPDC059618]|uniref:hypothetical protein n=1 Tax=Streptomyces sp. NPDC059618 TaxID=3346887 RepID=UPI0036B1668E
MEPQRHALKALDERNCSGVGYSDFLTRTHKAGARATSVRVVIGLAFPVAPP